MTVPLPARQWRDRANLTSLVAAEAISNIGSRMTFFAIPWLVLVTTGSPVKVGLVTAAETLTYVVSGVLAAPLQDRFGDRRTSIWSDLGSVGIMAAIALFGQLDFSFLLVLVAMAGVLRAQADRSKVTMLVPLMESAGSNYTRVAAIREGTLRTSTLLGSSAAGIAIVFFGAIGGIWIDAGTFALAAILVVFARKAEKPVRDKEVATEPYLVALRNGFTWFRHERLLRAVTSMLFFTNLFNQASAVVFIPLWVLTHMDDPAALGAVATAYAVGLIAGSFVVAWLAPLLPRYPMLVAGYFIGGTPRFLVLALSDNLTLIVIVWLIGGVAMSSLNPTISAMIYQRTPKEMLARVGGIITAVAFGGMPLGGLLAGFLVQTLGLTNGILVATAFYFVVTLTPVIWYQLWRELNDTAPPRPVPDGISTLPQLYEIGRSTMGPRVTLRYAKGEWTLRARHRLRTIAPRQAIEPKVAVNAVAQLDIEPVRTAVRQALDHDRVLAERQIRDTLRALG